MTTSRNATQWNEDTKSWGPLTEDDAAANWVRDFFLERNGNVTFHEVDQTFNPVAKRALQRLTEEGYIVRGIGTNANYLWPMQQAS